MATKDSGVEKLDSISDVEIDDNGVFKYVLIKVGDRGCSKHIVRGYRWAEYHADIYEKVEEALGSTTNQCVGGGRIKHDRASKSILVYGYSIGFGQAKHSIAVYLLKKHYPNYSSITWNNDGY